ncbi:MAG TPA: hypothetical protein PKW90_13655, partial [Myxococcota bacterium]|nr:hypothetical protein [Myxococcota bacterium]
MATDPSTEVRLSVAGHPDTPGDALSLLVWDPSAPVR